MKNGTVVYCCFCKTKGVEQLGIPTIFGAMAVCPNCLPKYRQQLQQAMGRFDLQQAAEQSLRQHDRAHCAVRAPPMQPCE